MAQERCIPLIYRQEAILQNVVIEKLSLITAAYLEQQARFKKLYPPDDVRPWTFQKIAQILAYYRLSLCYSFGILSRSDNVSKILEPEKAVLIHPERAGLILKEYEQYITFSFFHVLFSSFESSMRSIVAKVPLPKGKGKLHRDTAKFSDIYNGLIDYTGVNGQYRNLFELLLMVRNCIHNRSIYSSEKGSKSVTYKGVTYDFIQGKPIEFASVELIFDWLLDLMAFFAEVFDSPCMMRETHIQDNVL